MAIVFRSERKKIIRSQKTIVNYLITLLKSTISFQKELKEAKDKSIADKVYR